MRILLGFIVPVIFATFLVTLAVNFLQFWQQHRFMSPSSTFQASMHSGAAASSYWSGRV